MRLGQSNCIPLLRHQMVMAMTGRRRMRADDRWTGQSSWYRHGVNQRIIQSQAENNRPDQQIRHAASHDCNRSVTHRISACAARAESGRAKRSFTQSCLSQASSQRHTAAGTGSWPAASAAVVAAVSARVRAPASVQREVSPRARRAQPVCPRRRERRRHRV
jgi:hypothetical protein